MAYAKGKKGDSVYYDTATGIIFRAVIIRKHRDGRLTVVTQYRVDENGNDLPGFYGRKHKQVVSAFRDTFAEIKALA